MSEFFRGWRRKIGVATLLLACLLTCGWVRSFRLGDFILSANWQLVSFHGRIFWERRPAPFEWKLAYASEDDRYVTDVYTDPEWEEKWQWKRFGFAVGKTELNPAGANAIGSSLQSTFYLIPYWALVVPLTVVSGLLLWFRSRRETP